MTPATRREYAAVGGGRRCSREDAWQRAVEFLFERLAVRWEVAGVPVEGRRSCCALPLRLRDERAGSATRCASTSPSGSRRWRRRERPDPRAFAALLVRLVPRRAARPAGARALDDARRAAAARAAAAILERERLAAAARRAARRRRRASTRTRATAPRRVRARRARRGRAGRRVSSRSRRPRTRARWPGSTRRGSRALARRARRCASCDGEALVRDVVADPARRAAGGMALTDSPRSSSARCSSTAPDPAAAWRELRRVPGRADRAADAGRARSGSRPRAPT